MAEPQVEVNASSTSKGRFLFNMTANAEMCESCNKRVYATERLGTGQQVYHKACFRCSQCKKTLTLGQYHVAENQLFCLPHYKRVFIESGGVYGGRKPGEQKTGASPASTTSFVARQRSSDVLRTDVVRSPGATSGSMSPVGSPSGPLLSPTTDGSLDSDSVGNVKRMPTGTFAATRAMFEKGSAGSRPVAGGSGGSTPVEKPMTPSGLVSKMRAEREAASRSSEITSPASVHTPPQECTVRLIERYNVDKEKEQKADEEKERQKKQEIKEQQAKEQEIKEQQAKEREQDMNHKDLVEIRNDQLDKKEQPLPVASGKEDSDSNNNDDDYENLVQEQEADLAQNHEENQSEEEQDQMPAAARNEDDHDYELLVNEEEQEVGERGDGDLIQIHDEDQPEQDQLPAATRNEDNDYRAGNDADDHEEDEEEEEKGEEDVNDGDGDLIQIHDEDQPDEEQQPATAYSRDEENNNDENKYPDNDGEDSDVTAEQQQQRQNGGYSDNIF